MAKKMEWKYHQRESPGVPLEAKKRKRKKTVTLRQLLLGEKEKEDSNPETTTTGDCNSVKDVPKDLATLVSSSADDTGVPAVSLTPALSARLTSEAW
jgi:hypothetical protein